MASFFCGRSLAAFGRNYDGSSFHFGNLSLRPFQMHATRSFVYHFLRWSLHLENENMHTLVHSRHFHRSSCITSNDNNDTPCYTTHTSSSSSQCLQTEMDLAADFAAISPSDVTQAQAEVVLVGCGAPNRGMGWYHAVQMLEGR